MINKTFLAVLVLLASCVVLMQGMPTSIRERCLCRRQFPSVNMELVATVQYHKSTGSCGQEELLVIFKNGGRRRCLNIHLRQGRRIKEAIMKKNNARK
ncbi:C-X-C motif chemokine 11-1-like [Python bivittatus]|uniref:C-X-C motif chemokine 11-1-like n=1 Tax=Python bivittatus TaxID=176946 RepID=A0A9F2RAQ9_PYTBI|nr:C-X-C motif chemokine 11-1-like [Python bivittatus]